MDMVSGQARWALVLATPASNSIATVGLVNDGHVVDDPRGTNILQVQAVDGLAGDATCGDTLQLCSGAAVGCGLCHARGCQHGARHVEWNKPLHADVLFKRDAAPIALRLCWDGGGSVTDRSSEDIGEADGATPLSGASCNVDDWRAAVGANYAGITAGGEKREAVREIAGQ